MPPLAETIQNLLLRELGSVRRELDAYPDDESVWAKPAGVTNSGGTLVLHVAGNLQHYVGAVLGDSGYVRRRDREFAAEGLTRDELRAELAAAERAIESALAGLTGDRLSAAYPEAVGGHRVETGEFLVHLAVHLGYHLGQLSYHRRMVAGDPRGVGALSIAELGTARPV